MALLILAALIVVPMAEIALFIQVGGAIGLWPTLAIVVLTAFAGTALLRAQGTSTLNRARESLDRGVFPVAEVFDGLCLLVAGALLLTPGFFTDTVGLLLFVPAVRGGLRELLWRWLRARGDVRVRFEEMADGEIIEAEYEIHDEDGPRPGGGPVIPGPEER